MPDAIKPVLETNTWKKSSSYSGLSATNLVLGIYWYKLKGRQKRKLDAKVVFPFW